VLHRLRGLRALLGGWIEIGVPPGSEDRVQGRLEEDMAMLARLDWLGTMLISPPPLERMNAGEAPIVLLAVALGLSSAEEARARMPQILEPRAAVAAALWLQAKARDGVIDHDVRLIWEGRGLGFTLSVAPPSSMPEWEAAFGDLLLHSNAQRIVFRPGCFAPWVAVQGSKAAD